MKLSPALRWISSGLMLFSLVACEKKAGTSSWCPLTSAPQPIVSAEPTSFDAIAKHLDSGGQMYCYLSTEKLLKIASEKMAAAGSTILSTGKLDDAKKAKAEAAWQSFSKIVAQSGLKDISGFGASTIALAPGYYQSKWMLHHYEGKADGLIWQLHGSTPNALDFTAYLPEHTALASSGNLKLEPIWNAINQEAGTNADLRQGLDQLTQKFQQSAGLDLSALLASLGPNYSMVITLDESRMTTLPTGPDSPTVTIPEPGMAIFVQVQDEVLINRLDQELSKNPMVVKVDEADLKMRTFALPIPMPFLRPTVAWKQGLLMIGTSDTLIREMLDVKAGKKSGFAANAGFKKLLTGLPTTGCGFGYVSPAFQKLMQDLQVANLHRTKPNDPAVMKLCESIYSLTSPKAVCSVTQETSEGWIGISHEELAAPAGK